jgi:hypothetical protein
MMEKMSCQHYMPTVLATDALQQSSLPRNSICDCAVTYKHGEAVQKNISRVRASVARSLRILHARKGAMGAGMHVCSIAH